VAATQKIRGGEARDARADDGNTLHLG
jgi:hypothetical protein